MMNDDECGGCLFLFKHMMIVYGDDYLGEDEHQAYDDHDACDDGLS